MKLFTLFILLFSFKSFATCMNPIAESELIKSKAGVPNAGLLTCKDLPTEPCHCMDGKDKRKWMPGQIDNPESPKYLKKGSVSCSDFDTCQTQLVLLDCSSYAQGTGKIMVKNYSEVYCAEPDGFNPMPGVVTDPAGIIAADAEDQARAVELSGRLAKVAPRFTALKICAVNADALTDVQLRTCLKRLIREVLAARMMLSEL